MKKNEYISEFEKNDIVVVRYGWNNITKKPFEFLYEFGYYSNVEGKCVVYNKGERSMQDSHAFDVSGVRLATSTDLKEYYWGH